MSVRTVSVSLAERAYRQVSEEAARAGVSMSDWLTRAAREKIQRDAAARIAEADSRSGHAWAEWAEANTDEFPAPGPGQDVP